MNRIAFNTRPLLGAASELATLLVMVGMTAASAAVWAAGSGPVLPQLPTVVVTGKAPISTQTPVRLPLVVVTAKRSGSSAAADAT